MFIPVLIFGLFFVILGGLSAFLVWMAVRKHRRYKLLSDTRMTSIGSLRPGLAKTTGLVRALEEPVRSPMTRRDCVFYDFRVEEQRTRTVSSGPRGGMRTETYWATVVNDRQYVRFSLEEDTGEVEIDLEGAEVTMRSAAHTSSSMFDSAPPDLERLLRNRYATSTRGLFFNKTMRYVETVIEEADRLIALGEIRRKKRGDRHVLGKGNEVPLIVSDKSDRDLASGYAWSRNLYAIGAVVPLLFLIPVGIIAFVMVGAFAGMDHVAQNNQPQVNNPPPNVPWPNNPPPNRQPLIPPFQDDKLKPPAPPPLAPQPAADFVAQAVQEARGNDPFKRRDALARLERAPEDAKQRKDFEDARGDAAKRKEVAALLTELVRTDRGNRRTAANALKLWMTPDVVPELIAELEQAKFGNEKAMLIELLGASKDTRAVPALVKRLRGLGDTRNATAAIEAIGPEATPALVTALQDATANREQVCRILAKIGTADALPALKKLTADGDKRVATAAKDAEKQITERTKS
jgi:E3 Ubiquitin ligase